MISFNPDFLYLAVCPGNYPDTSIEVLFWAEVLGVIKRVAGKAKVPDAVKTVDGVGGRRPLATNYIPALTEEFHT